MNDIWMLTYWQIDTAPYVCDSNLKSVLEKLEQNSELAIAWFEISNMKQKK